MSRTNIHEAKTHLSRLIEQALRGEEVVISRRGRPIVRLVKFTEEAPARRGGQWAGLVRIADDFDAPLPPEIQSAFEGKGP